MKSNFAKPQSEHEKSEQYHYASCNLWKFIRDDGIAARDHLEAGYPIFYCDDRFDTEIVREWPDGRQELVKVGTDGEILQLRSLPRG
jgi:hypothetical protein